MALTKLNMAVFAPMPSASVSTATAVNPGVFSNWRKANLRSFIAQRFHRIDARGAPGRDQTGQQGYCGEEKHSAKEYERLGGTNVEKLVLYQAHEPIGGNEPSPGSNRYQTPSIDEYHAQHMAPFCTNAHANPNLLCALHH